MLPTELGKKAATKVKSMFSSFSTMKLTVIETTGNLLCQLLPQSIHAVTAKGFELKVMLFALALSVNLWVAT